MVESPLDARPVNPDLNDDPVGQLAGHLQHPGPGGGDVDRYGPARLLELKPALPELYRVAGEDRAQDTDFVSRSRAWGSPWVP